MIDLLAFHRIKIVCVSNDSRQSMSKSVSYYFNMQTMENEINKLNISRLRASTAVKLKDNFFKVQFLIFPPSPIQPYNFQEDLIW